MTPNLSDIKTGFPKLDQITGGLGKSDLVLFVSPSSEGTIALAMNIATHLLFAKRPQPVLFFSLGISHHEILSRFIAADAKINLERIRTGSFVRNRWQDLTASAARFAEAPLYLNSTCMTAPSIISVSTDLQNKLRGKNESLALIVIDQVRYLRPCDTRWDLPDHSGASWQAVHEFMDHTEIAYSLNNSDSASGDLTATALKQLASDLEVTVLALYQHPTPNTKQAKSSLASSDRLRKIENDFRNAADIIAIIDIADHVPQSVSDARIKVAKNAHGRTGSISMYFESARSRFTTLDGRSDRRRDHGDPWGR